MYIMKMIDIFINFATSTFSDYDPSALPETTFEIKQGKKIFKGRSFTIKVEYFNWKELVPVDNNKKETINYFYNHHS